MIKHTFIECDNTWPITVTFWHHVQDCSRWLYDITKKSIIFQGFSLQEEQFLYSPFFSSTCCLRDTNSCISFFFTPVPNFQNIKSIIFPDYFFLYVPLFPWHTTWKMGWVGRFWLLYRCPHRDSRVLRGYILQPIKICNSIWHRNETYHSFC